MYVMVRAILGYGLHLGLKVVEHVMEEDTSKNQGLSR